MKLLLDENLSRRLFHRLARDFPESAHADALGLHGKPDAEIWRHAREHGFVIVSKDDDFRQLSFLHGAPHRSPLAGSSHGRIYDPTVSTKAKVSVSVRRELLREVDRAARGMSRSEVFERAIGDWLRERRREELDRSIERYYRSVSSTDRAEDAAWASLGDEAVRRSWKS